MRRPAALLLVLTFGCSHSRTHDPAAASASFAKPEHVKEDRATSALIDGELGKTWASANLEPAPRASDPEFLRRVSLDLIGRVPTLDETRAFLAAKGPKKREQLVDRLLSSPEYAKHWTDVFLALLVGRDQRQAAQGRQILGPYLTEAFSSGVPYDRLATELLTATGTLGEAPEGAFLVRHAMNGGPEAVTGKVASVFLGLQIQCAQCHDHPYDQRWKQQDFWALAGYFARTKGRRGKGEGPLGIEIADVPRGEAQMPVHATGKTVAVQPRFLGRTLVQRPGVTRREQLATALVESDLFAKEAVNRTWALLFGRGLVDPVDDLGGEHDPAHPPLLTALATDFADHGYDLRRLLRAITSSEAYQRASAGGSAPADAHPGELERHFARAAVRPMQPEQLFRSLLTITGAEAALVEKLGEDAAEKKLEQGLKQYLFVFNDDEMGEVDSFRGSVPQALALMNGELATMGTRAKAGGTLSRVLAASKERSDRVDALFLAAYARPPEAAEKARALEYLDQNMGSKDAFEDLFHALLTSAEATLVH